MVKSIRSGLLARLSDHCRRAVSGAATPVTGFAALVCALLAAFPPVAIAGDPQKPMQIYLLLPKGLDENFTAAVRKGAGRAASEQTLDLIVRVDGKSLASEISAIADAIAAAGNDPDVSVSGIVMAGRGPDDMAAALAQAAKLGVPVITIGAGMDIARAAGAALHVGPDNFAAGRAAGEKFRDAGAVRATCVKSPADTIAQQVRCMGLQVGLERPVTILVLPDPGESLSDTAKRLLDNRRAGDALLFVAANPLAVETARSAATLDGKSAILVAAFDPDAEFSRALGQANAAFAITTQPELQGYLPVLLLAGAAKTGAMPTSDIATGPKFITAK